GRPVPASPSAPCGDAGVLLLVSLVAGAVLHRAGLAGHPAGPALLAVVHLSPSIRGWAPPRRGTRGEGRRPAVPTRCGPVRAGSQAGGPARGLQPPRIQAGVCVRGTTTSVVVRISGPPPTGRRRSRPNHRPGLASCPTTSYSPPQ